MNINGFYNELKLLIQTMADKGFLKSINQELVLNSDNIDELINKMQNYKIPTVGKWTTNETT